MKRSLLVLALMFAVNAFAQDPANWPTVIDGNPSMGPYAWVDGPTAIQNGQKANAVLGGAQDSLQLYICRASLSDGVHPGKFFNNQCNIGWGKTEVVKTTDYQLLVNAQPSYSGYLSQSWVAPGTPSTFVGGSVAAGPLRVCHGSYNGQWHPGKEWQGKCNIGYGGAEVATDNYQLLVLTFNKTSWQQSSATLICSGCPTGPVQPMPVTDMSGNTQGTVVAQQMYNGFWLQIAGCAQMADVGAILPKDASATVVAGTAIKGWFAAPSVDTFGDPRTWFVRENMFDTHLGTIWFRLRYFANNLCLQAASATDHAPLTLQPCSSTNKLQWWTPGTANGVPAMVSGASIGNSRGVDPQTFNLYATMMGVEGQSPTQAVWMVSSESCRPFVSPTHFSSFSSSEAASWKYVSDRLGRILP